MEKELTEAKKVDHQKRKKQPKLGKRQKRNKDLFKNRSKLIPVIPY